MKTNLALALALAAMPAVQAAEPQEGSGEIDGYKLVWQELFDDGELKPERWNIEVNGDGGGNSELQYYTDREENVRVGQDDEGNGCLILTARREAYSGRQATSGRVNSLGKIAFKYGKVEASIRLPKTANGLWPAFWMMGNDYDQVGWPACFEMDIMEMGHQNGIRNATQELLFNGACHWGPRWDAHYQYSRDRVNPYSLQDGEFHLFTTFWDEEKISMYVDIDKHPDYPPYYEMTIPASTESNAPGAYFHKEGFIIFNLAVGGNFPGIWDINGITALNEANGYEASMYVNYVRIYQKGLDSESTSFADEGDQAGIEDMAALSSLDIVAAGDMICMSEPATVEVYNLSGIRVMRAESATSLSTGHLAPGAYIVRAVSHSGQQKTEKIICR